MKLFLFLRTVLAASTASTNTASLTTTPTSTPTSTTDLSGLIAEVPACALSCLTSASSDLGCTATDLTCVCRSATNASASLAAQLGACLLLGSCDSSELNTVESLAPRICAQVTTAASAVLSAVSTEIAAELASQTGQSTGPATASTSATGSTGSGAKTAAPPAGGRATMALLAIGGVAVLAVYAL